MTQLQTLTVENLEKEILKRRRIAAEWAGKLHDLAEERLPEGLEEIHEIAAGTYNACRAWKEALNALQAAQNGG